jgi:hypothetical protein
MTVEGQRRFGRNHKCNHDFFWAKSIVTFGPNKIFVTWATVHITTFKYCCCMVPELWTLVRKQNTGPLWKISNATIKCCWFHKGQTWWRNIQIIGSILEPRLKNGYPISLLCHSFISIKLKIALSRICIALPHKMLDAICRRLIMLKIYTYWIHVFNQFRMGRKTYEAQNQNDIYKNIFKSHLAQT